MNQRILLFTLACLVAQAGSTRLGRAHAQGRSTGDIAAGRSHFEKGVEYFQDGDLKAASIEFKRAYIASPNYRVLYNLGQVSYELRDYAEAQRYFQRYLTDGAGEIEGSRKREVEATVAKLSGRIATIVLSCNVKGAELSVDDVVVGKSPMSQPVRVSAGTRRISAAVSGRPRSTRVVEAAGGDTLVVQLDVAPPSEETPPSQSLSPESVAKSKGPGAELWLGIGAGALAVGAGVIGILASGDAGKYRDAIQRKTTPQEVDSLHDRATTKALVTDILLGAAVVTATIAVVIGLQGKGETKPSPSDRDTARTRLDIGAGSLRLTNHFE
jgi:hypothetical protein